MKEFLIYMQHREENGLPPIYYLGDYTEEQVAKIAKNYFRGEEPIKVVEIETIEEQHG